MTESENIMQRLGKLERQNRYMKLAVASIALLLGVSMLVEPGGMLGMVPHEIKADRIVVVDPDGNERIVLDAGAHAFGYSPEIVASLELRDSNEETMAFMCSADQLYSGGVIVVCDKTGEDAIRLHVDENSNGIVDTYDREDIGKELKPGP